MNTASNNNPASGKARKRIKAALIALGALLLLVLGGGLLWLRSDYANNFASKQLVNALKAQGIQLSIDDFSGPLPGRIRLKGIELADAEGVWLRAGELNLELGLASLLSGTLRINRLSLNEPELLRLPLLPETEPEEGTGGSGPGFDLNLPVGITLDRLSIKNAIISWAALGIKPTEDGSLLDRAARHPLDANLEATASLADGKVEGRLDGSFQAGDILGLNLSLAPAIFGKQSAASMLINAVASITVRWDGHEEPLRLEAEINQDGPLWNAGNIKINGLGLSLSSKAELNRENGRLKAELKLKGRENASWQSIVAELTGQDQTFMAAIGNPLSIDLDIENTETGAFSFKLAEMQAGLIRGEGEASAQLPGDSSPPGSQQGRIDAAISLNISDLKPLAPGFEGPVQTSLKASGNFEAAELSLDLASPSLLTPAGEADNLAIILDAALSNILKDNPAGRGNLKASSSSMPGLNSGLISMSGRWDFALSGTPEARKASARIDEFSLQAFGAKLQSDINATLSPSFFAEQKDQTLWPSGLAIAGGISLAVEDWASLSRLSGMQIKGKNLEAQIHLDNNGAQAVRLSLAAPDLAMPGQEVQIAGLRSELYAEFVKPAPNLRLELESGAGAAGPIAWSSLSVQAGGNSGRGDFKIHMLEAPQADSGKNKKTKHAESDLLALSGSYDLNRKQIELANLHAKYPNSPVTADLQEPARFAYGNGMELGGLNLAISPAGALSADASIHPNVLNIQANLTGLPFSVVNTLAQTSLPPGHIDAVIDFKNPSKGSLETKIYLDKKRSHQIFKETKKSHNSGAIAKRVNNSSPTDAKAGQNSSATPDITLSANLGRSSGRLALSGSLDFNALTKPDTGAEKDMAQTGLGQTPLAAPLTFAVPMYLSSGGFPLPDMNAPFRADLVWLGEIAPLWEFAMMPDRDLSGLAAINMNVGGRLSSPRFKGSAYMAAGQFEDREHGIMLSNIELGAHASSRKDFSLTLTATDGGEGKLGIEGSIELGSEPNLNLRGRIEHLSPLHRDDLKLLITGLVAVTGPLSRPNVNVQTIIEQGEVTLLDSLMTGSIPTLEIYDPENGQEKRKEGALLDISVDIPRRFYIRGRGLDSEWKGRLKVAGPSSSPEIKGILQPVRGQFNILSRNFKIAQGGIEFAGGTRINPALNLALTYSSSNINAIVRIGGNLDHPSINMESSPPLPQDEVLAHVLFGKSVSDLSRFEALQLANGLRTLSGGGESFDLLVDMRETTGLDVLRVGSSDGSQQGGPQVSGQSGSANLAPAGSGGSAPGQGQATLEAGKYINDSIYVGVDKGINQENTTVRVEIELFPRVTLQGSSSPDSSQVGVGWKKDY